MEAASLTRMDCAHACAHAHGAGSRERGSGAGGTDLAKRKLINPSTMGSHENQILQQALRCRGQHFWKSPWSASPVLPGSLKRGSPRLPTWSRPSCCRVQPTSRAQAKCPPRSSAPHGRSGSLSRSSHCIQGPDTLGSMPARDRAAPTGALRPRVPLLWLPTDPPRTPAPFPAAPQPRRHSLISEQVAGLGPALGFHAQEHSEGKLMTRV